MARYDHGRKFSRFLNFHFFWTPCMYIDNLMKSGARYSLLANTFAHHINDCLERLKTRLKLEHIAIKQLPTVHTITLQYITLEKQIKYSFAKQPSSRLQSFFFPQFGLQIHIHSITFLTDFFHTRSVFPIIRAGMNKFTFICYTLLLGGTLRKYYYA